MFDVPVELDLAAARARGLISRAVRERIKRLRGVGYVCGRMRRGSSGVGA